MPETYRRHLESIPFFSGLDDEALDAIAALATSVEVAAGHVLAERGFPGSGMFIITSGAAEVDLGGDRRIELGPGDFFGETALLTDRPRTARVHARTDATLLALSRRDFLDLLRSQSSIAIAMLTVLAERLADAQSKEPQ
jgi:CRP-like cAMP-binding protein